MNRAQRLTWPTWLGAPPLLEDLTQELMDLIAVPAPPHGEERRAAFLRSRLHARGCAAAIDGAGNVVSRWGDGDGPAIAFLAHIDTALDVGAVRPRRADGRIYGHGAADNGAGVTALACLAAAAARSGASPRENVYFVFNVGEEGLGDLRGARAFVAEHRRALRRVVALDGRLGDIVHQGVASRRLEVVVRTPGGHSWSDYGRPSAIHLLARGIAQIAALRLPRAPRTTLNVGRIEGGSAVNAIAQEARCLLDLRSAEQATLQQLERDVRAGFALLGGGDVSVQVLCVGDRPGGGTPRHDPLVGAVLQALAAVGVPPVFAVGSTDANAAFAARIPAVCCGAARGGLAHTQDEWLDEASLGLGTQFVARLLDLLAPPA